MKERFAKLLLGEDMSGGGKGVSSALALSNAFTNLAGTLNFSFLSFFLLLILSLPYVDEFKEKLVLINVVRINGQ